MTGRTEPTRRLGRWARPGFRRMVALLLLAWFAVGCASHRTLSKAREEEEKGHWDLAVIEYSRALEQDPNNLKIKMALQRARFQASSEHFKNGKAYRASGHLQLALVELQMAVALDPTNTFARAELEKAKEDKADIERLGRERSALERLKEKTRGAQITPPMLDPTSKDPISLSFPKETNVKDIYTALAKASGINVLFDPQLKDDKITVELEEVTLQRALEIIMRQVAHFYKVLDAETIIIAADTPQNRKDYEDLVIKTFFLSSGDVKEVMNVLRTLIEARRIAMNQQLNAIVIRDTVDKVAVAERIINSNDKSKAEVVIDVELMQVNSSRIRELGVDLTSTTISQSLSIAGSDDSDSSPSGLRWNDLVNITAGDWIFSGIPGFTYTFLKNNGESTLLAKPQLRITEGEKATLTIGDRVPIPTTTFNTGATGVGGTIVPITSFQYQDVGIKIDIEPRVHHNREVTLKLTIEVSQLGAPVEISTGQTQPSIGTRTITSVIRLMDGETNFLAGLIRTDSQTSKSGVPFLMDIPVLGRLFSSDSDSEQRTDLLLTLTPHIIRMPDISEEDLLPIWVGTEQNITFHGTSSRIESPAEETPFGENRPLRNDTAPGMSARPMPNPREVGGDRGGIRGPRGVRGGQPGGGAGGGPGQGPRMGEDDLGEGSGELLDGETQLERQGLDADLGGERSDDRPTVLRIEVPEEPAAGRETGVRVVLDRPDRLGAFQASLVYDPAVIEVLGVETSAGVHSVGSGFAVDRIPGVVRFSWTAPPDGESGRPLEAWLKLRPLRPGRAELLWSGGLGEDPAGRALSFAVMPAVLEIGERPFDE